MRPFGRRLTRIFAMAKNCSFSPMTAGTWRRIRARAGSTSTSMAKWVTPAQSTILPRRSTARRGKARNRRQRLGRRRTRRKSRSPKVQRHSAEPSSRETTTTISPPRREGPTGLSFKTAPRRIRSTFPAWTPRANTRNLRAIRRLHRPRIFSRRSKSAPQPRARCICGCRENLDRSR